MNAYELRRLVRTAAELLSAEWSADPDYFDFRNFEIVFEYFVVKCGCKLWRVVDQSQTRRVERKNQKINGRFPFRERLVRYLANQGILRLVTNLTSFLAEEIENVISTFNLSCCENLWRRSSIVGMCFVYSVHWFCCQIKNVFSRFIAKSAIFALLSISYWKVHLSKKKSIELEQDWVRRQQAREIVKVTVVNLTKNVVVARFKRLKMTHSSGCL